MSKSIIFLASIVLVFAGCAIKEEALVNDDKSFLSFPVVISKLEASENQKELENTIKKRVELNSFFRSDKAIDGVRLDLSLIPSCQRYGVDKLIVLWIDENNVSRHFKAEYPITVKKESGGRSFIVTLKRAKLFEPKHPSLMGFSNKQSAMIYSDAKWLHDGLLPTSDILRGIKL